MNRDTKQWEAFLLLLSIVVLMKFALGVLAPSCIWASANGHQCEVDADGNPNLLTLYAPGHSSSPVPDEDEENPGACLPVSAGSPDPDVMSLLRLEVCKPGEMDAVHLEVEGGEKIRLFHPVPGTPLETTSLTAPISAVWIQAVEPSGQWSDISICAEGEPYERCRDRVTMTAIPPVDLDVFRPGTLASPGELVPDADEENPQNLLMLMNIDDDNWDGIIDNNREQSPDIAAEDDDLLRLIVRQFSMKQGTLTLSVTHAGLEPPLRAFHEDGSQELSLPLTVDLAEPDGPLSGIGLHDVVLVAEALSASDAIAVELAYAVNGKERARDDVHLAAFGIDLDARWPCTKRDPGALVDESDERNSLKLIATVNDDDDNRDGIVDNDREQSPTIAVADDDLMTFIVRKLAAAPADGTLELFAGDGLHVFTADGARELDLPLMLDLADPSGPLEDVFEGDVTFLVEANIPVERTMVELIYSRDGKEEMRDEVHLMVAQPGVKGGFTRGSVQYTEAMKLGGDWIAAREFDAEHPLSLLFPNPSGERRVYCYVKYRKKGEGSYQDGWLLNADYFESLAETWNAILDRLHIPASLFRYKSGSITQQLSEASGIPANMLSSGYFSTGQIKDVGEYEIRFLDADKNQNTATGLTVKVLKPGFMLGKFRIIGDTATPYVHEEALTLALDNGEAFFRTLGGMRVHLEALPDDALAPYIVGYNWSVTPNAGYAFPADTVAALELDLKNEQVPQALIDLLKTILKDESFPSRKSVVEAIRPAFMGYAITDEVLAALKTEFERERKAFSDYLFKEGDGLTVFKDTHYETKEELFAALGDTDFERSGNNPKRVRGYRVAGYRVTKEALTALFEEEVMKNQRLPGHIYHKLASHEKNRTTGSACILGNEGEGWSFRNVDAGGKNVEFTEALQKVLVDDYTKAYEEIIQLHASHIVLFGPAIARHADTSTAYGKYRDRCENAVLEHGAAGVTKGDLYKDYTTVEYESVQNGQDTQIVKIEIPPLNKHELHVQKEFADAPFQLRNNVYWQSAYRPDLDEVVTLSLTFGTRSRGNQIDIVGSVPITRRLKSRVLQQGITGDDVSMLQALLRSLGLSHKPAICRNAEEDEDYGYCGTPVIINRDYDKNTHRAISRLQYRTLIFLQPNGKAKWFDKDGDGTINVLDGNHPLNLETLERIEEQWNDYLNAFDAYPEMPVINLGNPTPAVQNEFNNNWLPLFVREIAKSYSADFVARVEGIAADDPQKSRKIREAHARLAKAWTDHESPKHWEDSGVSHRISLGGADNAGSIGFSQIQHWYKYGVPGHEHPSRNVGGRRTSCWDNVNLYHPGENLQGFATWVNSSEGNRSFYYAFMRPDKAFHRTEAKGDYPQIISYSPLEPSEQAVTINPYKDMAADRLSKGLMGNNQGAWVGNSLLLNEIWPDILRKFPRQSDEYASYWLSDADTRKSVIKGIKYALEIKHNASIPQREWTWKDIVITTGSDGICQTEAAGDDIQFLTTGKQEQPHTITIMTGTNKVLDTKIKTCFTTEEYGNFLEHYSDEIKTALESLKKTVENKTCFDMAEILDSSNSLGGAVEKLEERNDDRIEEIHVAYGEEDWLNANRSYLEECQEKINNKYP